MMRDDEGWRTDRTNDWRSTKQEQKSPKKQK